MGKQHYGSRKRQGGLSLIPELWEAIDQAARLVGVPRNRVVETVLMREFGFVSDSPKLKAHSPKADGGIFDDDAA